MFLTKKVPAFETWLKSAYSPIYERSSLGIKDRLEYARGKCEDSKYNLEEMKFPLPTSHEDNGRYMLRKALMQQEIAQYYQGRHETQNELPINEGETGVSSL
jgi:hypothetical protein